MWGEGTGGWGGFGDCEEVALGRGGCEDAGWEGVGLLGLVLVLRLVVAGVALVTGVALVAGGGADVAGCGPQAARARAGAQASKRMAAGRASRMGRDVSKSRVPGWR
jgi:hypothetical protein